MPPDFDPATFQLATILTAAGATVASGLIASLIEILKRVPVFGPWLDNGHEAGAAVLTSLVLVIYAYVFTAETIDPVGIFGAFLAWVGIAALSTKSYDVAVTFVRNNSDEEG